MPDVMDPSTLGLNPEYTETNEYGDLLKIAFIDVGQGDATLLISPNGNSVLIDTGPNGEGRNAILPLMSTLNVNQLDAIFITHYHADHIGGLDEVLMGMDGIWNTDDDHLPTQGIFDRGGSYESEGETWFDYQQAAEGMRSAVYPGQIFSFGEISVQIVAANSQLIDGSDIPIEYADENSLSIGLVIEYGDLRLFIGGDLTGGGGNPPYETADLETPLGEIVGNIDVYQVNHHGSHTSSNESFINSLSPDYAIISCGNDNDHFHPHESVIERLLDHGAKIYQTEMCWTGDRSDISIANGHIVLKTDGYMPPSISFYAK